MRIPLSREDEKNLIRSLQAGDESAANQIIDAYENYIKAIAANLLSKGANVDRDDLVQEGRVALYKAAQKFNLNMDVRLSTFGKMHIEGAMKRYMIKNRTIRLPENVNRDVMRFMQARDKFLSDTRREPTDKELAGILNVTEEKVFSFWNWMYEVISADMQIGDSETTISDQQIIGYHDIWEQTDTRSERMDPIFLQDAITSMKSLKEREILKYYYGLEPGSAAHTRKDTCEKFGISQLGLMSLENKLLSIVEKNYKAERRLK